MLYYGVMFEDLFANSGLSLDRLRSFLQVAEAGSLIKAAEGNVVRQGLFSRQIRELEEFFGVELTERRGKGITISMAGARLALLIRQQFQDLDDFRREQADATKSFVIGGGASILEWMVAPAAPAVSVALDGAALRLEPYRSRALVEAVREGRVDFALVREDALAPGQPHLKLARLSFHLCVPKSLLPRGTTSANLRESRLWQPLPFAAGKDGGQLDSAIRDAMTSAGVDFRPRFECSSVLLVRRFIEQGVCAGILPSVGMKGLPSETVLTVEFPPLANYGRSLVLHWNERQVRRRGVEMSVIKQLAAALCPTYLPTERR